MLIESLAPDVGGLIDLEQRLAWSERVIQAFEQALEATGSACLLLDDRARVILCNRRAEAILAEADGLALSRTGRLSVQDAFSAASFRGAVRQAIQQALDGSRRGPADPVRIERPSGKRAYNLFFHPCDPGRPRPETAPHVLVIVTDPDAALPSPGRMLTSLYGLTPAECRVTRKLLDGMSPNQIAEALGVTRHTVRTQLKSVLSKTNTRRQSELVSLILRSACPGPV